MLRFRFAACAVLFAAQVAHAAPTLHLPEPAMPPPRDVAERGESPVYYRLPDDTLMPSFRSGFGTSSRLAANDETAKTAFALDVLLGAAIAPARGSRFTVLGEAGYSFVGFSEHYASLGIGPFLRMAGALFDLDRSFGEGASFGIVPHALLGSADGAFARGVRTSAIFAWQVYGLEVAHQYVVTDARRVHEVHVAITLFAAYPGRQ